MTVGVAGVWQVCGAFLTWDVVSRLAGSTAGIRVTIAVLFLSEVLLQLIERRG